MSTPHVTGLLAYFLSLEEGSDDLLAIVPQSFLEYTYTTIFRMLRKYSPLKAPIRTLDIPSPAEYKEKILQLGTPDVIDGDTLPEGSPNLMAFNGYGEGILADEIIADF